MATQNSPSYVVEVMEQGQSGKLLVMTLYSVKLPQPIKEWWYSKKPQLAETVYVSTEFTSALRNEAGMKSIDQEVKQI
jgi:hypothetical protein